MGAAAAAGEVQNLLIGALFPGEITERGPGGEAMGSRCGCRLLRPGAGEQGTRSAGARLCQAGPAGWFDSRGIKRRGRTSGHVVVAGESPAPHDERMTLTLRSPAFEQGAPIPARFDHERGDLSPALAWDGVPEGAASLVLLVDDPDAPVEGSFVHWVLVGLDPARQGIAEGEEPAEASPGVNGFGRPGYLGPAPPPGDDPHRYVFRLLAVDEPVPVTRLPSYQDVEAAVTGHTLSEARLIGTYQR
jgi:Raf kinase inhibitor-like YbhB/YbcL family protein